MPGVPRNCLVAATFLAVAMAGGAPSTEADAILGRWDTGNNEALFEFFRSGNGYDARLIPLRFPHLRDSLNPSDSLKTRPLRNILIVRGLVYNGKKKQWENGTVYNPSDGRTYSCLCRLTSDKSKMKFRGYLGISVLGGTRTFTRRQDP